MCPNTERCTSLRVFALAASLIVSPCTSWADSPDQRATPLGGSSDHPDRSIRRALSLLRAPTPVPIDVIDARKLPRALRQAVEGTCAYVQTGVSRIRVNSSCPVYRAAGDSLFQAMKLAAILRHEMAHLDGADEARAYLLEAETFRELLRPAPRLVSQGIAYAVELERRAAAFSADTGHQARLTAGRRQASKPQQLHSTTNLPVPRQ